MSSSRDTSNEDPEEKYPEGCWEDWCDGLAFGLRQEHQPPTMLMPDPIRLSEIEEQQVYSPITGWDTG